MPRPDAYSSALQLPHTPPEPASPAAHESQPSSLELASSPWAQRSQSLLPGSLLLNPLGHAVHAVSWLLLLYCPGAQAVHEVRGGVPLEFTTEPAAHVMHAELVPVTGANVLPAQASHTWVVVFSNLPRAHGAHVVRGFDGCEM